MKRIMALMFCLLMLTGCSDVSESSRSEDQKTNSSIAYTGKLDLSNKILNADDKQEIVFSEIDEEDYSALLYNSNPALSSVKSDLEYINSLCPISRLRQNSNDENIYYCKYSYKDENLILYVFFENSTDFTTLGAIDVHVDSQEKTAYILNNVGEVSESVIDGIADVDLPFGESTKLERIDSLESQT